MGSHPTPKSLREKAQLQEEEFISKYPGFISYKECMGRAYGWGLAAFAITFSCSYFGFKAVSRFVALDSKYSITLPSLLGPLSAYYITKEKSRLCHECFFLRKEHSETSSSDSSES